MADSADKPVGITKEMIAAYDDYTHLHLDRRRFMREMTKLAGSTSAALAATALIAPSAAQANMIAPDDGRLDTSEISLEVPAGALKGYLARPADAAGPLPAVMVVHENRGLNAHIRDVARRVALEGFTAFAPDFLSLVDPKGTPDDPDAARAMFSGLSAGAIGANGAAAVQALAARDDTNGKVGAMGFCWGGGAVNHIAVAAPEALLAAAPFYGRVADAAEVETIKAEMMLHYAGLDARINAGIESFEAALKANDVTYQLFIYEGVNHAFHNDTADARYDEAAAKLAFSRTMDLFKRVLS